MEVITIENKAYQELMHKLNQQCEYFQLFLQTKEAKKDEKKDEWIDSVAVCNLLNISTRTLHRMIRERSIGYSCVRGRYRFKHSDVEQFLSGNYVVSNPKTFEELRQAYTVRK